MTEVAFHFGAPDKIAYTCRLLRKAVAGGARVAVVAAAEDLRRLDVDLWAVSPTDFVPHCLSGHDEPVIRRSPVALVSHTSEAQHHRQVLVNLGDAMPEGFESFERVIEVVSLDDEDRSMARGRWKRYSDLGYPIVQHNLATKGPTQ